MMKACLFDSTPRPGDRYQVVVHVDAATLAEDATPEVGAVVRRALEAALDEDRRAAASREPGEPDPVDEVVGVAPSFGQRQADRHWGW